MVDKLKKCLSFLFVLLLIVPVFNGLPARPEVAVRQPSISILAECSRENDCYPHNINITETNLIDCIQGVCLCYPCFQFNSTTEKCSVSKCFTYEPANDQCIDNRKSQKEAFLFSFFFSSLGVANFYIGDVTLGISQLMITVAFLSLCYCCLCYSCCIISYEDSCCTRCFGEDSCLPTCTLICCVSLGFSLLLTTACWWIVDLIIFSLNERPDGMGCTLKENL